MKKVVALILCMLALGARSQPVMAQGASGRMPPNEPGKSHRPKPAHTEIKHPPPAPTARINIRTQLPNCYVLIDGQAPDTTDARGQLTLSGLTPGQHTLTVRKPGYHDYQEVIRLQPGANDVAVSMLAYPGNLSIATNVSDATIVVIGSGTYSEVRRLELAPGTYQVRVLKLGYNTVERSVEVKPGVATNLALTLDRLSLAELQTQTETTYNSGNYSDTITLGQLVLESNATHSRTQLLVGLSLVHTGDYNAAAAYIGRAIQLGETLTLPVKHFHKLGHSEGLCSGNLTLRRGSLEFRSDATATDNFSVPLSKTSDLRLDWDKGGRVLIQIALPKGKKEARVPYSFHPAQAFLRHKNESKPSSPTLVDCNNCQSVVQLLYQLIARLGQ